MITTASQARTQRGALHTRGLRLPRLLAALGLWALAMLLIGSIGAQSAQAAPLGPAIAAPIDTDAVTEIVVHKFEQPVDPGLRADGLPQDTSGLTPVAGAEFTATRVPGIDLTSSAGQQAAAELTAAEAAAAVAGLSADATGTTDAGGDTVLGPLAVGVYFVTETVTPPGYVGSASFVVALPLTHPVERDSWLTTVHVYPKNAHAGITLDVIDEASVALGDTVQWVSRSDIPSLETLDGYRVEQRIDSKLALVDDGAHIEVRISAAGAPTLALGADYTLTVSADGRSVTVDFTETGLAALAEARSANPAAQVQITYRTEVLDEGELTNTALLYASRAIIDGAPGAPDPVNDENQTKWGPLSVLVHEKDHPAHLIEGAQFELYTSEDDARTRQNPITVHGKHVWTTDANGRLVVHGLRFSDFVNGLQREGDDPLTRLYWAAPISTPEGWTWVDSRPLAGAVQSVTDYQTLIFEVERATVPPVVPGLTVTGSQILGILILGILLFGGGAALIIARRRRGPQAEEEDAIIDRERPGDQ